MVPKNDDSSISLLTTKFKGLHSSTKVPASITSISLGSLDKSTNINNHPFTLQEDITVQEPRKLLMAPIELHGRKADTEPVLNIDMAEQVY